jgi:hypothetical protein
LVDKIAVQQPGLTAEQQYQLARKLVGAEIQAITYREFLPALLGSNAIVPRAEQYLYSSSQIATITDAFAHSAFRFGHSAVTSQLNLASNQSETLGGISLNEASFNPALLSSDSSMLQKILAGAATQRAEEIDSLVVDEIRNIRFGPPGAGGLDLIAIDIQRGRDHGMPNYNALRFAYGLPNVVSFSQITSDPVLAHNLQTLYGSVDNIDSIIGGLAEDHLPESSTGVLFQIIIANQFKRLRDGDRLFYISNDAGLYTNGKINPAIALLVDLENIRLSDIINANSPNLALQRNVFFVQFIPEPATSMLHIFIFTGALVFSVRQGGGRDRWSTLVL